MTITTHPRIWIHRDLLPFVHEANHQIEYVTGDWSGLLSVAWGLEERDGAPSLTVTITDLTNQHKPLTLTEVSDVDNLVHRIQDWRAGHIE